MCCEKLKVIAFALFNNRLSFQDPVMRHGWRTGAILPELEVDACYCILLGK